MSSSVLDASALLAVLNREAGWSEVEGLMHDAAMNAVNLSEVATKLISRGAEATMVRRLLDDLGIQIVPFDRDIAYRAAELYKQCSASGLSLGDRACLATGFHKKLPVYTADRAWADLPLALDVRCIR